MRKGQSATEFLILLGFLLLVFGTLILLLRQRNAVKSEDIFRQELLVVQEIIDREIKLAHSVQSGYERTFELPLHIRDELYTIQVHPSDAPSEVALQGEEFEHVFFLQTELAAGARIAPGFNTISKNDEQLTIAPVEEEE